MADSIIDSAPARRLLDVAALEGLDLQVPLCSGDEARLRPTELAQPALLLVEVVLNSLLTADVAIVGVAGHSVGEYAALVAGGSLQDDVAMRLVVQRGRAMAAMREGTMVALLGADQQTAEAICAEITAAGRGTVVIANLNGPGQIVLSGDSSALAAVADVARAHGVRRAVPLPVSGAFHSPLMRAAAEEFATAIDGSHIADASIRIACNVDGSLVRDSASIRDRLRRQLVSPVRWEDCVRSLVSVGAEALVEVGPGSVLSGLARRIARGLPTLGVATAEEARSLAERLASPAGA
jgi:[acyl-carrier-protein] S-malonyltransferase